MTKEGGERESVTRRESALIGNSIITRFKIIWESSTILGETGVYLCFSMLTNEPYRAVEGSQLKVQRFRGKREGLKRGRYYPERKLFIKSYEW